MIKTCGTWATRALTWRIPATSRLMKKRAFGDGRFATTGADEPEYVTLDFEKGVPVALNGKEMSAKEIVLALNEMRQKRHRPGGSGGKPSGGHEEPRRIETPGGAILYRAPTRCWKPLRWIRIRPTTSSRWLSSLPTWCTTASGIRLCAGGAECFVTSRRSMSPARCG